METRVELASRSGIGDGYARELPLEHDLGQPITVDAAALGPCHPMFLVRLRMFLDWHRAAGREPTLIPPRDPDVERTLRAMGVTGDRDMRSNPPNIPVRRLNSYADVEALTAEAIDMIEAQTRSLAVWSGPLHTAVGELCDNAVQHGTNPLGVYVAADRLDAPHRRFRLAIADLGIGIPEHIRTHHPEWHDDTAAITRALVRGVTGTGDPHRGNGFAEVLERPAENALIRTGSAAVLDIRSAGGHVCVELVGGQQKASGSPLRRPDAAPGSPTPSPRSDRCSILVSRYGEETSRVPSNEG